jgi:TPR repeat protein
LGDIDRDKGDGGAAHTAYDKAIAVYEKQCTAAKDADDLACIDGAKLIEATSTPADEGHMGRLYETACARKRAEACYERGLLIAKNDRKRAVEWFTRACTLGHSKGCDEAKYQKK